jgi:hypothetical protein
MLTLAHLWQEGVIGRRYRLRVRRIIESEAGRAEIELAMQEMVRKTRFEAEIDIVVDSGSPLTVIARESEKSALCFVGLNLDAPGERANPVASVKPLVAALKGEVALAKSWADLHGHENQ